MAPGLAQTMGGHIADVANVPSTFLLRDISTMWHRYGQKTSRWLRRTAFTLVELLVVIAIIGILVALLLPAVRSRRGQVRIAEDGVKVAAQSYLLNAQRIEQAQGLPIEALQSLQALDQARREYLRTVIDYNSAQFNLCRALGWPDKAAIASSPPDQK